HPLLCTAMPHPSICTLSLHDALPILILVGEIRDRETMSAAIAYAQSGHLCLATMHANNSYQALNRILSFYPVEVRSTMLGDLAADRKSTRLNSSHRTISYAVFCLKKK